MPLLQTSITIHAEPGCVWNTLTDFGRYPEWNPLLRSVDGEFRPGETVRMAVKLRWLPVVKLTATVCEVRAGSGFDWAGSVLASFIFCGHHSFALFENPDGSIRFEQAERYSGALSPLAFLFIPVLRLGFERMNDALKARAEEHGVIWRSTEGRGNPCNTGAD